VDQKNGSTALYIGRGSAAVRVSLEGSLISEIAEVCPLPDGRLVVYGDMGHATAVYVVDKARASVVDAFWAYYPAMSPDQRWIAYVKFYPLHGVEGSDECMVYDLTKTPVQNRPADEPNETIDVGGVIFPPGHRNFPGSNTQIPAGQRHLGGTRLYWAADSRAILFEDRAASGPGVVLVTLDEKGAPSASRRLLTTGEICGRDVPSGSTPAWKLDKAEVGPGLAGGRTILVDLASLSDNRCAPHVLQLDSEDFQPARTEANVRPTYTRGAIVDGKEAVPPPRKMQ
jgi:hypothetical protein